MSHDLLEQKRAVRKLMTSELKKLGRQKRTDLSAKILDRLHGVTVFRQAGTVHCYVAWRQEVDTHPLIQSLLANQHKVVIPIVQQELHKLTHSLLVNFADLQPGAYGILELPPERRTAVDLRDLDVIIVPGVAFDLQGNRIGYGGGFYDAFLKETSAVRIGLCYGFQILDKVPVDRQDEQVDLIVSEEGVIYANRNNS